MPDEIIAYLGALESRLKKTLSPPALKALLEETEVHLRDLEAELGSAAHAIARFGDVDGFAKNIRREQIPNSWVAAKWPIITLLVGWALGVAVGFVVRAVVYSPFSSYPLMAFWPVLVAAAFAIACFRCRRLIPIQLALFCLCFFVVGIAVTAMKPVLLLPPHGTRPLAVQSGGETNEASEALRQIAVNRTDLDLADKAFRVAQRDPRAVASYADGDRFPTPEWYTERGLKAVRVFRGEGPVHVTTSPAVPALPDKSDFYVAGLPRALATWNPDHLARVRSRLDAEVDLQERLVAGLKAEGDQTYWRRLRILMEATALEPVTSFVPLFTINLLAFVLYKANQKRKRGRALRSA